MCVVMFHLHESVGQLSISIRQRVAWLSVVGTWHLAVRVEEGGKERKNQDEEERREWGDERSHSLRSLFSSALRTVTHAAGTHDNKLGQPDENFKSNGNGYGFGFGFGYGYEMCLNF